MSLYTQNKSKVCPYILRTRVKYVLIYSKMENVILCSLPWTHVANLIWKGTVFRNNTPATVIGLPTAVSTLKTHKNREGSGQR